jgi:hypothetical protein
LVNIELQFAALKARMDAMQSQLDGQEERIAALVEGVNLLKGDEQRIQALIAPVEKRNRRFVSNAG